MREVWGSIPGPVKSAQCRQRLATAATLLRSCVAQTLSRGDGPRHSLHASAYSSEYNEDLILILRWQCKSDRKPLITNTIDNNPYVQTVNTVSTSQVSSAWWCERYLLKTVNASTFFCLWLALITKTCITSLQNLLANEKLGKLLAPHSSSIGAT